MKKAIHGIAIVLIAALLVWKAVDLSKGNADGNFPNKPIHLVVPYNAGGGTDSFVRLLGKSIADHGYLPQPLVVLNQPGGSGTIGSRYVKDARPDGYRILCHHESIITAKLSGAVNFGPESFEPIAMSGNIELIIVVREDAPYETIRDLLEAAKDNPDTIRFGANMGSPAHFTTMNLESTMPGARFNLVNSGGGQTRYTSLIGGHLDAGIFSLAEFLNYRSEEGTAPDKNIRALACLSSKPIAALPETHTCVQDGVDTTSSNAYYWWAPEGTPPEAIEAISNALEKAMQDPEVVKTLNEWSLGLEFIKGPMLRERIDSRVSALQPPEIKQSLALPNYPLFAFIAVIALGAFVAFEKKNTAQDKNSMSFDQLRPAAISFGAMLIYVALLQFTPMPYALATAVMITIIGGLVSKWDKRTMPILIEIALITGLGSEFIFTQVFTVTLP